VLAAAGLLIPTPALASPPARGPAQAAHAVAAAPAAAVPLTASGGRKHTVTWDHSSLLIDGQRTFIWSGEFHYWRLPSPDLWRDVLEKMKAGGFNATSIYFDWGFHSPRPGVYDFSGIRDVDKLLDIADEVGIFVIARPGPYINAETDSGGFPGYLDTQAGHARSSAADYTAAYREWLHAIDPILARHQLTQGNGPIIAVQAENEYTFGQLDPVYMQDIQDTMRADGITVPTTHNDAVPVGNWAQAPGSVNIYGFDNYPLLFDCSQPDNWNGALRQVPEGFEANARKSDPTDPVYVAEYQGGSFDPWGGPGYDACRKLTGPAFQKVFYKTALAQAATMVNAYMTYGGTSWGWLPFPGVYTSYDYGSAIGEARQLNEKYDESKRLGYLVQAVAPLRNTELVTSGAFGSNPSVDYRARINPDTKTEFFFLRHAQVESTTDDTTTLSLAGADGAYPQVPQAGPPIRINGRDSKLLVAGYDLGAQRLVYSTSEIMTHAEAAGRDVAVLYGRNGEAGETVLRYAAQPKVTVLSGSVTPTWDALRGDLRLNYTHSGLAKVLVEGGTKPLLLLLGTDDTVARTWHTDTAAGPVLTRGPYLVRAAQVQGGALALRGDTDGPTTLDVYPPAGVTAVTWNGSAVATAAQPDGALRASLAGPPAISLPTLHNWRYQQESPELQSGFDDAGWTRADHQTTNNPTKPKTLPVLYSDDYGYHYGLTWFRGHFSATGTETGIALDGRGGDNGSYSAWLNGTYLGTFSGAKTVAFPAGSVKAGRDNVVAVLVENMGHDEDFVSNDSHKGPRGLYQADLQGSSAPVSWRLQGPLGGEQLPDPTRGSFNTGGLYGERNGWYLPGYDTSSWTPVTLPDRWNARQPATGIGWYRTSFSLNLPQGVDAPLGLTITDDPAHHYKAYVYLNGWLLGRYWNDKGPQTTFSLPTGLLNPNGDNQLAVAVWGRDATDGGGLGDVQLSSYGVYAGGVPVGLVASPGVDAVIAPGADLPEAPLAALLPVAGLAVLITLTRRRRRRGLS